MVSVLDEVVSVLDEVVCVPDVAVFLSSVVLKDGALGQVDPA